jgi:hypothetical protein
MLSSAPRRKSWAVQSDIMAQSNGTDAPLENITERDTSPPGNPSS